MSTLPDHLLSLIIANAQELVRTSRVSTQDDFKKVLESGQMLEQRLAALDPNNTPRGDDELIHHLRSPLNLVVAYTTVILDEVDEAMTETQVGLLREIEQAAMQISIYIAETFE